MYSTEILAPDYHQKNSVLRGFTSRGISDMANLCYFGSYFETQGRIACLERKDIQCLLNRISFLLVLSNVYAPSEWRCGCLEITASFGNGKDGALYKNLWPPIHPQKLKMHSLIAITRLSLLQVLPSQSSPSYGTLTTTTISPCVIRATLNNPPVNLWDFRLAADFYSFINSLAAETTIINGTNLTVITDTKVVILSSANPDFSIAHYDIHALTVSSPELPPANGTLIGEQLLRSRTLLATLPVILIAEINGLASGAGNEVAVQCDFRYAGPAARLGHIEVGFGLPPGTGGVQFLVKLIGRTRALEYILSARSVDAVTAAAIG